MKVLVFHTGSLGDTLIALPAFKSIREHFKGVHITLLSDNQGDSGLINPKEILKEGVFVDSFLRYNANQSGIQDKLRETFQLAVLLRKQRFDTLIYLIRTGRPYISVLRDLVFFRIAGIKHFYGYRYASKLPSRKKLRPLPFIRHETDNLLFRLEAMGIKANGQMPKLHDWLSEEDFECVNKWVSTLPYDGGRPWLAIGPGSKMQGKVWPKERYFEVVKRLIYEFDIWPVVFGGQEDRMLGEYLIRQLGRGYVAAGALKVRPGIVALSRCIYYLGNDTGTMHMAVVAGIPCVAVFSARDFPGLWYPYGEGHIVIRKVLPCEGCMLETCVKQKNKCLMDISSDEVYEACREMMNIRMKNEMVK
ncbi:MAG: glycosyltransferase family 9 protein [Deltaproteobacteria bacterium]|nr:glycosyltransferase family 9 protein [Deltaproteobacteria bacterium]